MDPRLNTFIAHARSKGMDHGTIRLLLLASGWKEREIVGAMATEGLDLPVPEPQGGGGARDAFLYLLAFSSLYCVLGAVLVIAFEFIDYWVPDVADRAYYYSYDYAWYGVRWSLATIIVSFPIFAGLSSMLRREIRREPERQQGAVRRWLVYLTLLAAAGTMAGDLITLLFYFLEGSFSAAFLGKVIALFLVAAAVFGYYLFSLRPLVEQEHAPRTRAALLSLGLLLVGCALCGGFYLVGSPETARLRRIDEHRLESLRDIQRTVQAMMNAAVDGKKTTRPLPQTLDEIAAFSRSQQYSRELELTDPETGERYGYKPLGTERYELCATFTLRRDGDYDLFWNHPAGRHCYEINWKSPP